MERLLGTELWGRPEPSVYRPARRRCTAVPDPRNGTPPRPDHIRAEKSLASMSGFRLCSWSSSLQCVSAAQREIGDCGAKHNRRLSPREPKRGRATDCARRQASCRGVRARTVRGETAGRVTRKRPQARRSRSPAARTPAVGSGMPTPPSGQWRRPIMFSAPGLTTSSQQGTERRMDITGR